MLKRIAVILLLLVVSSSSLFAQRKGGGAAKSNNYKNDSTATLYDKSKFTTPKVSKSARDFVMLQMGYNNWISKPDSVKTKSLGYFFNAAVCYDFPIKKTKLSFAAGLGVNTSVVYLDQQVLANTDTAAALSSAARFIADTNHYKRYKFVTAYLTAPFELRYYSNTDNRNNGFKAAIGLSIGTLLGAHTKALTSVAGTNVKEKVDTKRYVSPWNFAATARVGLGNFTLFGSYNLTNVFKENAGPPITPFSAGLCISGL